MRSALRTSAWPNAGQFWGVLEFFAGIAVADFRSMLARYERLMGKPPELRASDAEAVWQVTEHAGIYVADVERAGKMLLTILADDLEEQVARLAARGLPVGPIEAIPTSAGKAVISDPEGNSIT